MEGEREGVWVGVEHGRVGRRGPQAEREPVRASGVQGGVEGGIGGVGGVGGEGEEEVLRSTGGGGHRAQGGRVGLTGACLCLGRVWMKWGEWVGE